MPKKRFLQYSFFGLTQISIRSQGGSNLSFPHVFGRNPYFFRQMDARQACPRMSLSGKHSGMTE
ncbi:hypothetical protein JW964_12560, partial [candidate division KSB1 bacterium]|nr:hypothetical protein [candidate division KSB1 bacterium]